MARHPGAERLRGAATILGALLLAWAASAMAQPGATDATPPGLQNRDAEAAARYGALADEAQARGDARAELRARLAGIQALERLGASGEAWQQADRLLELASDRKPGYSAYMRCDIGWSSSHDRTGGRFSDIGTDQFWRLRRSGCYGIRQPGG